MQETSQNHSPNQSKRRPLRTFASFTFIQNTAPPVDADVSLLLSVSCNNKNYFNWEKGPNFSKFFSCKFKNFISFLKCNMPFDFNHSEFFLSPDQQNTSLDLTSADILDSPWTANQQRTNSLKCYGKLAS